MLLELTELIFENRNKSYGAYQLRKNYHKALLIGLSANIPLLLLWIANIKLFTQNTFEQTALSNEKQEVMLQVQEVELQQINFEETPVLILPKAPSPTNSSVLNNTEPKETQQENFKEIQAVEERPHTIAEAEEKPTNTSLNTSSSKDSTAKSENSTPAPVAYSPDFWSMYVKKNLRYPPQALQEHKECNVFVSVIINEEGKMEIDKEKATFGCEEYFNQEVHRLIANAPRFIVSTDASGKPQKRRLILKIPFELPEN